MMKRFFKWYCLPVLVLASALASAQTVPVPEEPVVAGEVEVLHVAGNVYLVAGAGANIAVQAGEQGVMVVDTGVAAMSDAVIDAIAGISDRPIRYIVNTSAAPQHVGGNAALASLPGGSTQGALEGAQVNVVAREEVLFRMSSSGPDGETRYPSEAWPVDGYFTPQRGLTFNGEAIDIIHMPGAHSEGDTVVYFRGSNVLVTGDIYTNTNLPMINYRQGGSYNGLADALDRLVELTVTDVLMEGGTYVIPGHGYIADEADVLEYRDMVYIIRDRLRRQIVERGMSLEEVKAERPVLGWEARYERPGWTVDMFLEAVYGEFQAERRGMAGED